MIRAFVAVFLLFVVSAAADAPKAQSNGPGERPGDPYPCKVTVGYTPAHPELVSIQFTSGECMGKGKPQLALSSALYWLMLQQDTVPVDKSVSKGPFPTER